MNTRITYLYRDASNYKQWNVEIFSGTLTEEEKKEILAERYCGEYFIPHQVGLPEKRFDDVTDDDHCWFELWDDAFTETEGEPTVKLTAREFYNNFLAIKENWNETAWMERC